MDKSEICKNNKKDNKFLNFIKSNSILIFIIFFIIIIIIIFVSVIFVIKNNNIEKTKILETKVSSSSTSKTTNSSLTKFLNLDTSNKTLVQNVSVTGYSCYYDDCTFTIMNEDGEYEDFGYYLSNSKIFVLFENYRNYITLNIYYSLSDDMKVIVDYEVYIKANGDKLEEIETEEELRDKLNLYKAGTYTETFTLKKIGGKWVGDYGNYVEYTFVDKDFNEYKMNYYGSQVYEEGNSYKVTFNVVKGDLGYYQYDITSID